MPYHNGQWGNAFDEGEHEETVGCVDCGKVTKRVCDKCKEPLCSKCSTAGKWCDLCKACCVNEETPLADAFGDLAKKTMDALKEIL